MGFVGQFFLVDATTIPHHVLANAEIVGLLVNYAFVFQEPITLSPTRKYDHRIPLKTGAQPVNCRPYKSSFFQKGGDRKDGQRDVTEQHNITKCQSLYLSYSTSEEEGQHMVFLCRLSTAE
jgi:hypothetical protein